jgi:hypothetical protein
VGEGGTEGIGATAVGGGKRSGSIKARTRSSNGGGRSKEQVQQWLGEKQRTGAASFSEEQGTGEINVGRSKEQESKL